MNLLKFARSNAITLFFLIYIVTLFLPNPERKDISLTEFNNALANGKISKITVAQNRQSFTFKEPSGKVTTVAIPVNEGMLEKFLQSKAAVTIDAPADNVPWWKSSMFFLVGILAAVMIELSARIQLAKGPLSNGELATLSTVTFDDVAGQEAAKDELMEVVNFLKNPERYTEIGAKLPKGTLLVGPPGTGKTLLAKAVAGEAGVPFVYKAGAEFEEIFVGQGAKRVRDLFDIAKRFQPSIIFLDEIDAIGSRSQGGLIESPSSYSQTITQLLTELDGFDSAARIVVIAATNQPDKLDPALLRPGRFDRQVLVDLPDLSGREAILKVHARGKSFAPEVDFHKIAKETPGFSGADLANLLNEAAIVTVRRNGKAITTTDINAAEARLIGGSEKRTNYISPEQEELVAYHETGHALVAHLIPGYHDIKEISVIPRGRAAGLTWFTPIEEGDINIMKVARYREQIRVALGGRCAEELVYGRDNVSVGAAQDLMQVRELARQYVMTSGIFIDELGPQSFLSGIDFLGNQRVVNASPETAERIEGLIRKVITEEYEAVLQTLTAYRMTIEVVVAELIKRERLTGEEFAALVDGVQTPNSTAEETP